MKEASKMMKEARKMMKKAITLAYKIELKNVMSSCIEYKTLHSLKSAKYQEKTTIYTQMGYSQKTMVQNFN